MQEFSVSDIFHNSWDSLRAEKGGNQIIKIMRYLQVIQVAKRQKDYTRFGYYVRIIIRSIVRKQNENILAKLDPEQLVDIFNDLAFIRSPWYFFPQPLIKGSNGVMFKAPDEHLANMSYNQWKFADAKFTAFLVHKNEGTTEAAHQELGKLMACLYIPEGGFRESDIEKNAAVLSSRMKQWEQLLALETFGHIRTKIVLREKDLFPSSSKEKNSGEIVYTGEMWKNLHYDLADTEAFRGYDAAGQANIYHALDYLNKKAEEREKSTS